MGKPKAPTPPDPKVTAQAQTGTNLATAQANAALGNVDQETPYGNLDYSQSGTQFIADPNGAKYWKSPTGQYQSGAPAMVTTPGAATAPKQLYRDQYKSQAEYDMARRAQMLAPKSTTAMPEGWSQETGYYVPTYKAKQTLSPSQQRIFDASQDASGTMAETAAERAKFLQGYLKKDFSLENSRLSGDRVEKALLERMQPGLESDSRRNEAMLANRGIGAGSLAYDRSRDQVTRQATDSRLAAILAGGQEQSRMAQLEFAARNQPINEISALMANSQVQQPNFVNPNMPTIPTVDYAGLVNENYAQRMQGYQAQMASRQSMLGGIMGMGAAFLGNPAIGSDVRIKKNITRIGELSSGIPVYTYHYREEDDGAPLRTGVMAQDVQPIAPEAIEDIKGVLHVRYELVPGWAEWQR